MWNLRRLAPDPDYRSYYRPPHVDKRLGPVMKFVASRRDPLPVQLHRSRIERYKIAFEQDAMCRLRNIVDVRARTPEMDELVHEWQAAAEEAEAAELARDPFEESGESIDPFTQYSVDDIFGDGQEHRTENDSWTSYESQTRDAATVLGDIRFTMLSWIESIWLLCVDKVSQIDVADWTAGHELLRYIAKIARDIRESPHYTAQNMEGWLLKSTSGQVIRSFRFDDSFRDIIWLAMWIWRDICVAAMAQGIMTDSQVLSVLHEIRTTVNSTFYSDLLEIRALPAPDEVLSSSLRIRNTITLICSHWSSEQVVAFKNFRPLYFRKHITNFRRVAAIKLYKHITSSSPTSKHSLLAHLQSLWTPDNILSLSDHDIIVIVGYYLTERNHELLLNFYEHLSSRGRECPFAASVAMAREWVKWDAWRIYAAHLVEEGLKIIRDEVGCEIYKVTGEEPEYWEGICQAIPTPNALVWGMQQPEYYPFPWETVWSRLEEYFPCSMDEEHDYETAPQLPPLDEMLYTRFLEWLDLLAAFPQTAPPTPCPDWAPEQTIKWVFVDSKTSGLMQWITKPGGYQLARAMADVFHNRKELEYLGSTLYDLCVAFLPLTPGLGDHEDVTEETESLYSEQVRSRCVQS